MVTAGGKLISDKGRGEEKCEASWRNIGEGLGQRWEMSVGRRGKMQNDWRGG